MSGHQRRHASGTRRRKAIEACERCREKRIKCDGTQPCQQCVKKGAHCEFAPDIPVSNTGTKALEEKMDFIMTRLDHMEKQNQSIISAMSISTINSCGQPLGKISLAECSDTNGASNTVSEQRWSVSDMMSRPAVNYELGTGYAELETSNQLSQSHRTLPQHQSPKFPSRKESDQHLFSFFHTAHVYIPILNEEEVRKKYSNIEDPLGNPPRSHFSCLLYSILALGALYEIGCDGSSHWAPWYFSRARMLLWSLSHSPTLSLVQAALYPSAYLKYILKPRLAYLLNGFAIRLAFAIGMNVDSIYYHSPYNKNEIRRSYWMLYVQEVELILESGCPNSFSGSAMDLPYPDAATQESAMSIVPYHASLSRILDKILKLSDDPAKQAYSMPCAVRDELLQQLQDWRNSLPPHLQFRGDRPSLISGSDPQRWLCDWAERQKDRLRSDYNLALIVLLRNSQSPPSKVHDRDKTSRTALTLYQCCSLDAARQSIAYIHRLFDLFPSQRRWSYYCFYCLQSVLVLLSRLTLDVSSGVVAGRTLSRQTAHRSEILPCWHTEPRLTRSVHSSGWSGDDWGFCELAMDVFQKIQMDASQRCAKLVRQYLTSLRIKKSETEQHSETIVQETSALAASSMPDAYMSACDDASQPSSFSELQAALYGTFYGSPDRFDDGGTGIIGGGLDAGMHDAFSAIGDGIDDEWSRPMM